jgi:hypothetical protein
MLAEHPLEVIRTASDLRGRVGCHSAHGPRV